MKGHVDNQYGNVAIDSHVIAKYAGATAVECFGIVGMAAVSVKDGLVKLLKRESLTRGISVSFDVERVTSSAFSAASAVLGSSPSAALKTSTASMA